MVKRKTKARRPARPKAHKTSASGGKLPKDAVTRMVILRAREGQEILLEAELRALIGPSRKEEGCLTFDLQDRKSTRLNSSHVASSYAVFCLKKKYELDGEC